MLFIHKNNVYFLFTADIVSSNVSLKSDKNKNNVNHVMHNNEDKENINKNQNSTHELLIENKLSEKNSINENQLNKSIVQNNESIVETKVIANTTLSSKPLKYLNFSLL
jgi:hypothetical protein